MRFDIITIFPRIFDSYFNGSILKRAQDRGFLKIRVHNLRDYTTLKHKKVDDKPYGGGAGMILMAEPIIKAVDSLRKKIRNKERIKVVIFSAKGKQFNQRVAYDWARKYENVVFVSGRYEGIDERVKNILKAEEISIGRYVLTDGDVAAMVVISAVSRLIPSVIKMESLEEESHWNLLIKKEAAASKSKGLEYPHYTRPEILIYKGKKYRVPKVLLSGNHKKIAEWRSKRSG